MTFVSYAQNFEDVLLWRALHDVEAGRYIDIGAHDPEFDSVSLAFYKEGWRGIHVDPIPLYASHLREKRPDEIIVEAAVTDAPGPIPFYELAGLSSGRKEVANHHETNGHRPREIVVPAVRLDNLLELREGEIHWLKIDVEGMEAEVLRSWGKSSVRPWILVIESTFPNSEKPTQQLWIEEVSKRGYTEAFFDGLSRYFVHETRAELAERLNRPANVFDAYQITQQHFSANSLHTELDHSRERIREYESDVSTLRSQLTDAEKSVLAEQDRSNELQSRLSSAHETLAVMREAAAAAANELANARQSEVEAARELAHAAKSHAAEIVALSSEFRTAEAALRHEFDKIIGDHRLELEETRTAKWAAEIEGVRLQERTAALEITITGLKGQVEASGVAAEQARSGFAQELERYRRELDEIRALLIQVDGLVTAARSQGPGWWQRLGEKVGLARRPQSWLALSDWSLASAGAQSLATAKNHRTMDMNMAERALGEERNPYLRANSLSELLGWDDVDFVRCAYVTVLGRQPDAAGEGYYTGRLRAGHSKLEVLWQLRRSDEAKGHDPGIAGFDRQLRRARFWTSLPRAMRRITTRRPAAALQAQARPHRLPASPSTGQQPPKPSVGSSAVMELAREKEALRTDLDALKSVVEGLGHAVRGIAEAQKRHELQLRGMQSVRRRGTPASADKQ